MPYQPVIPQPSAVTQSKGRVGLRGLTLAVLSVLLGGCASPPDLAPLEKEVANLTAAPAPLASQVSDRKFLRAVQNAVKSSPQAARSAANRLEYQALWLETQNAFNPELSIGLGASTGGGFFALPYVSLKQRIFDAGQSRSEQTAARARLLGSRFAQIDELGMNALDTINAWALVATNRQIVAVSRESLERLEHTAQQIETRSSAGAGSEIDVLTARSSIENERAAFSSAQADYEHAKVRYTQIFGKPPALNINLPPPAPNLLPEVVTQSHALQLAQAEVVAAKADLVAAQAGRFPHISFGLSASDDSDINGGLRGEYRLSPQSSRLQRVAASKARLAAREADLLALQKDVTAQSQMLSVEARQAANLLSISRQAVDANRKNRELAYKKFKNGGTSLSNLIDLEREALSAEIKLLQASHQAQMSGWKILLDRGYILTAINISIPSD